MKIVAAIVERTIGSVLTTLIPRNVKRALFLTSIYHRMVGDKGVEVEELKKLDSQLNLTRTHDPRSLVLLGKMDGVIWKDLDLDVAHASREALIMELIKKTPCWLLYGRRDDILKDIKTMQDMAVSMA